MNTKMMSPDEVSFLARAGNPTDYAVAVQRYLRTAEVHLLTLECDPANSESRRFLAELFEALTQGARLLSIQDLAAYSGELKRLFDRAQCGEIDLTGPIIDALFDALGDMRTAADCVVTAERSGTPLQSDPQLARRLANLRAVGNESAAAPSTVSSGSAGSENKKLGELLLESGITTPKGLDAALRFQQAAPSKTKVGDILLAQAKVLPEQLSQALSVQKHIPDQRLGDILVAMHVVGTSEVEQALESQQHPTRPKLGEALIRSGEASAKGVAQTLRKQNAARSLRRYGLTAGESAAGPESVGAAFAQPDRIESFIAQSRDHLQAAELNLLTLESEPDNQEATSSAYRVFHGIRWVGAYLGLEDVAACAREVERLFERVRNDEIEPGGSVLDAAFDAVELLKELIESVAKALESNRPLQANPDLPQRLAALHTALYGAKPVPLSETPLLDQARADKKLGEILVEEGIVTAEQVDAALRAQHETPARAMVGDILLEQAKVSRAQVEQALAIQAQEPDRRLGDILVEMGAVDEADIAGALKKQLAPSKPKLGEALVRTGQVPAKTVAQTIRNQGIVRNLIRFGLTALGYDGDEAIDKGRAPESTPVYLHGDPKAIREFVARAKDHLAAADVHLLTLEGDAKNRKALDAVVRAFYTIKWSSEYFGLDDITTYARQAERLIDRARGGKIAMTGATLDAAFDAVEVLRRLVGHVAQAVDTGEALPREEGLQKAADYLWDVAAGKKVAPFTPVLAGAAAGKKLGEILIEAGITTPDELAAALQEQQAAGMRKLVGDILVDQIKLSRRQLDRALQIQKREPDRRLGDILVEMGAVDPEDIDAALEEQRSQQPPKLGELLVRTGRASAKAVAQAIRTQGIVNDLLRLGLSAAAATAVLTSAPSAYAATVTADAGAAVVTVVDDPAAVDTDSDGLSDVVEQALGTDAAQADTDRDGMDDAWEVAAGLNPVDGADAALDSDSDGLTNIEEYEAGSQPFASDTDADGWSDAIEVARGTDPATAASTPTPSEPADLNADGKVDAVDVQLVINAALGLETGVPTDVNKVGGTNALDVQSVINSATGNR